MDSILKLFENFKLENLGDLFKQFLPSWITGGIGSIFGGLKNSLGGLVGMLFGDKIDEVQNTVTNASNETLVAKVNPELVAVRNGTALNVTQFFNKHSPAFGVSEAVAQTLEAKTQSMVTNFYANAIPALKDGYPVDAYSTVLDYRKELVDYLAGSAEKKQLAALDVNTKNLKEVAERIATQITGIPKDADLNSLAANPPKFGLVGMLAATQTDLTQDIVMLPDSTLAKATVQAVAQKNHEENKNIQGGTTVTKPAAPAVAAAPAAASKPEKRVHVI